MLAPRRTGEERPPSDRRDRTDSNQGKKAWEKTEESTAQAPTPRMRTFWQE